MVKPLVLPVLLELSTILYGFVPPTSVNFAVIVPPAALIAVMTSLTVAPELKLSVISDSSESVGVIVISNAVVPLTVVVPAAYPVEILRCAVATAETSTE